MYTFFLEGFTLVKLVLTLIQYPVKTENFRRDSIEWRSNSKSLIEYFDQN